MAQLPHQKKTSQSLDLFHVSRVYPKLGPRDPICIDAEPLLGAKLGHYLRQQLPMGDTRTPNECKCNKIDEGFTLW